MQSDPHIVIASRAATRLRDGHVWVYRSDLDSENSLPPGSVVQVKDQRGKFLGTAIYSSSSQIALRMISPARLTAADLPKLIRERIREAIAYRRRVVRDTDAYRVIFSEADMLPGLIVDRYADILSLQVLTQAMDAPEVRPVVLETLQQELQPAAIVERSEPRIRELEELSPSPTAPLFGDKTETIFTMNGVRFHYSAFAGQKTGAFLDQRENYAAAESVASGEALDVFCYQGGFALHLARVCSQVTGVDSSRPALEAAERNAILNGRPEMEWVEANAFDLLRDYSAAGRLCDTIVLDPPAFARTKRNVDTALAGYKELNLRALRMLRPGGILITCSCSYHVSEADFIAVVASAAGDAHRGLRIVEKRNQSKDHPSLPSVPESSYLKCVILAVSS
ncbi:MAG: class I SAM-dependent rRNA methyltransferase [Acidobacteria bacterium]|nr:class I SAM-dependent rRNA methyltransferase [Acidobacteriota bacterium]